MILLSHSTVAVNFIMLAETKISDDKYRMRL